MSQGEFGNTQGHPIIPAQISQVSPWDIFVLYGKPSNECKLHVDKLEGPEDWSKWKWHKSMVLRSYELESIVNGTCDRVVLPTATESTTEQKNMLHGKV